MICVAELGCWIKLYPDLFLDNNYLKYIGWMLYDKVRVPRCLSSREAPRCALLSGGASPSLQDGFSGVRLCRRVFPQSCAFAAGDLGCGGSRLPWRNGAVTAARGGHVTSTRRPFCAQGSCCQNIPSRGEP